MASTMTADGRDKAAASGEWLFRPHLVVLVAAILLVVFIGLRLYQQAFGMSAGLDSTSPEFQTYWMTLVKIEIPVVFGVGIAVWSYLWFTRDRNLDQLDPKTEIRRYYNLVGWFFLYTVAFYWIASFFGEGDATWHQTVIRDTSFTASHNIVFYACIPTYMVIGIGSYLYAMTRIPAFARGFSVPLIMAVLGPALILPNLGFNEWGHAFWLTEEIFSHPLHWGFTTLGWTGIALGGVLMQAVHRLTELFRRMPAEQAA